MEGGGCGGGLKEVMVWQRRFGGAFHYFLRGSWELWWLLRNLIAVWVGVKGEVMFRCQVGDVRYSKSNHPRPISRSTKVYTSALILKPQPYR